MYSHRGPSVLAPALRASLYRAFTRTREPSFLLAAALTVLRKITMEVVLAPLAGEGAVMVQ